MRPVAIVISGLPASGKTTLGMAVAKSLSIPYLDKDHFLERLYEKEGVGNWSGGNTSAARATTHSNMRPNG